MCVGVKRIELSASRSRTERSTDDLHPVFVCPREESNLHWALRTGLFYPLNYRDILGIHKGWPYVCILT